MAQISAGEISKLIRDQIENYEGAVEVAEVGWIVSLGDGIARLHGLEKVMAGELLAFPRRRVGHCDEPGGRPGRLGAARRCFQPEGRRRGQAHGPDHFHSGRRGDDRPRGRCLGPAHRWQRSDRDDAVQPGRAHRARRHRPPAGQRADADRFEGHRCDDSDRPRAARVDYRRPANGQDRRRGRRDPQPKRRRHDLRLYRHRPKALDGGAGG